MLTRIFGKSAPVNYLLLSILLLCGLLAYNQLLASQPASVFHVLGEALALVFIMLLLDFIIRKNRINGNNNYGILIFVLMVLMVPQVLFRSEIVLGTVFCLLALRRTFSLYSPRNVEKKILDASLWIAVASFFSFYNIALLMVLYYAISVQSHLRFNHLLIPVLGMGAAAVIITSLYVVLYNSFNWLDLLEIASMLDFYAYGTARGLYLTVVLSVLSLTAITTTIRRYGLLNRKTRPFFLLLPFSLITLLFCSIMIDHKDGSEWLLVMPVLAAGTAVFVETVLNRIIREVVLWALLISTLLLRFL